MKFDKSPQWLVQLFLALQPEVGGVRRLMFGYPCAFENGHMFAGLFGDGLFVRLAEADRAALLELDGAAPFAPMKNRPMKEYAVLPPSMIEDEEAVKGWMRRGLAYAQSLPPKEKRPRASGLGPRAADAKSKTPKGKKAVPKAKKKR
jgi:TfoX/Sxy family transcriptional regulator of competence genes